MALGMILAGLSGAGNAVQKNLEQTQKFYDEQALARERADLEVQKQKLIAQNQADIASSPYQRFQQAAQNFAQEDVPVEAEKVTRTTPEGAKRIGLKYGGLINMTRDQVEAYKNPDMLSQYDKQLEADQEIAQEKVAGQTRKRSGEEAFNAALGYLKLNDTEAYLKVKEAMGKASEPERKAAEFEQEMNFKKDKLSADQRNEEKRLALLEEEIKVRAEKDGTQPTAMMQNVKMMQELGVPVEDIKNFILERKPQSFEDSVKDMAKDIAKANPEFTSDEAVQKAVGIMNSIRKARGTLMSKPIETLPAGAKKIGTSGGKTVYELPNGDRFVEQ